MFLSLFSLFSIALCGNATPFSSSNLPGTHGYAVANATYGAEYFYWYFDPQDGNSSAPLIIWLTGGPGCSSMLAALFENGPYNVDSDGTSLVTAKYGWNANAYLMYVDQPAPTGFSTLKNSDGYVANEAQVAADFSEFLTNFYAANSHMVGKELYVIGESYAGHYVPAITSHIVKTGNKFNLKGAGVGNGLVDPLYTDESYAPYFHYKANLVSESTMDEMTQQFATCAADINAGDFSSAFEDCNEIVQIGMSEATETVCIYDYTFVNPECGNLCYCQINEVGAFLNLPETQSQLGVDKKWTPCDSSVYSPLMSDFEQNYAEDIPVLLDAGVRWTTYQGNHDLICNTMGAYATLETGLQKGGGSGAKWSKGLFAAANNTWSAGGKEVGTFRQNGIFSYVEIEDGSHMVPQSTPAAGFAVMEHIVFNKPLA